MSEGELKRRMKKKEETWYSGDDRSMETATISRDFVQTYTIFKILDDAKAEFLKIIKKPVENDYELGIPAEREQLDHDCELYELFVKWFGESK